MRVVVLGVLAATVCGRIGFDEGLTLAIRGADLEAHDGRTVHARVGGLDVLGGDLDRFDSSITAGAFAHVVFLELADGILEVDAYVDADGDGTCGPLDPNWFLTFDPTGGEDILCTPLNVDASALPDDRGCVGHRIRVDLDGDGCVGCTDLAIVRDLLLTGDVAGDIDGDGTVTSADLLRVRRGLGLGCSTVPVCT